MPAQRQRHREFFPGTKSLPGLKGSLRRCSCATSSPERPEGCAWGLHDLTCSFRHLLHMHAAKVLLLNPQQLPVGVRGSEGIPAGLTEKDHWDNAKDPCLAILSATGIGVPGVTAVDVIVFREDGQFSRTNSELMRREVRSVP